MRNQEIVVSLDIGTTSIKVVVAEYINGQVNIIGVGNEKSRGLSRGVIVDIDETVFSIRKPLNGPSKRQMLRLMKSSWVCQVISWLSMIVMV